MSRITLRNPPNYPEWRTLRAGAHLGARSNLPSQACPIPLPVEIDVDTQVGLGLKRVTVASKNTRHRICGAQRIPWYVRLASPDRYRAATPALAHCSSSSPVAPPTPHAPITSPSLTIGTAPIPMMSRPPIWVMSARKTGRFARSSCSLLGVPKMADATALPCSLPAAFDA